MTPPFFHYNPMMNTFMALRAALGAQTIDVLVGALLGDAGARFNVNPTASIIFMQSVDKVYYVVWLWALLDGINLSPAEIRISATKPTETGNHCVHYRWWLPASYQQWQLASLFYKPTPALNENGRPAMLKYIPWELMPYCITWQSLAIWICDDGSKASKGGGILLSTEGFARWDVFGLVLVLEQHLGLRCSIYAHRNGGKLKGYRIYLWAQNLPIIQENVAKYMAPSMLFKIHIKARNTPLGA